MAVVFDAIQATMFFDGGGGATTFDHTAGLGSVTVGSGANRALIALIALCQTPSPSPTVTSVTWDQGGTNQAMTFIGATNVTSGAPGQLRVELWGLVAPTSGQKTLRVVTSAVNDGIYINELALTGVNQTGGTTSFANVTSNSATSSSTETITVTSAVGNMGVVNWIGDLTVSTPGAGETAIYTDTSGAISSAAGARKPGAAGTITQTNSATNNAWAGVGVNVVALATGGGLAIPVHNFKIDKFKTPSRSMGPNAGLFQVKAYPIAVSADTPASYVSRPFPPVQWNLNTPLLRGTAQDFSSSAVETNPHWQGRTYPPQWAITRSLLLPRAVVESSSAVETNPHWKPGTLPPQWFINRLLAQNTAQDFSSSAVETNPHWVARTWPIQWVVNASLVRGVTGDITTVVTTPDAPPPFIPRTWLPQWAINIPLHQNTAQDFSASDVETNPHWQSRSWPVAWSTQAALWQGAASDTPFAVIDTPVYFIPRTFPAQWLPNRALGQNTAQDFSASAVETNVQFRSRTWPLQWALQASLLRGTAQDFSTLPPATQPVYARYGASHGIGALSAIPGEIPS